MTAVALPVALLLGILFELASGLAGRLLGGDRRWWWGVGGIGSDARGLIRQGDTDQRVTVAGAGGATVALFGAGLAAAGALGVGPDDLPLLYLALAAAGAGSLLVAGGAGAASGWGVRGAAELAFGMALGAMFLRFGTIELDAVRATQGVLGTGLLLGPGAAMAGLVVAAVALAGSGSMRLAVVPADAAAGARALARLCRWGLAGATSLLGGVLLAGGALERAPLPLSAAALGVAVLMGVLDGVHQRLPRRWAVLSAGVWPVLAVAAALLEEVA